MTTESSGSADAAARLEALRQRRTGRSSAPHDSVPREHRAVPPQRTRRRHAAPGGRIIAGSLSAATALSLMGAMAHADRAVQVAPDVESGSTTRAPTVIVVRQAAGTPRTVAATATPVVTPAAAAAVTTSRGS
jgi:hypothetical protein